MKKIFLTLCCYTIAFFAFAQNQNQAPALMNVIPPSPTAAALGKYGEIPVSLYTGVPNISIPLYEINEGDIKLPISLSYHASGIKVEEIASNVGLGWSLNAGGVITRQQRGLPDEYYDGNNKGGYIYTYPQVQNYIHHFGEGYVLNGDIQVLPALQVTDCGPNAINSGVNSPLDNFANSCLLGSKDSEPDIFYFNFGGLSGKFFYSTDDNTWHTIPEQKLKIELENSQDSFWVITDLKGIKYVFEKRETVNTPTGQGSNINYSEARASAWFISRIISEKGDEVKFNYTTLDYVNWTAPNIGYSLGGSCSNLVPTSPTCSFGEYHSYVLNSIDFSAGTISFIYENSQREDFFGKALKSIIIKGKDNVPIKEYNLQQTYFVGYPHEGYYSSHYFNDLTSLSKRLKLNRLDELVANQPLKKYEFIYNETLLPSRMSYKQDYWGYYNGSNNLTQFAPTMFMSESTDADVIQRAANRSVNPTTSLAGSLTKIIYPTGGHTLFEYENNVAVNMFGIVDKIETKFFSISNQPNPQNYIDKNFEVKGLKEIASVGSTLLGTPAKLYIQNIPANYKFIQLVYPNGSIKNLTINDNGTTLYLPKGTYRFLADFTNSTPISYNYFSFSLTWEAVKMMGHEDNIVGGLRIKRILKFDGLSSTTTEDYKYYSGQMEAKPVNNAYKMFDCGIVGRSNYGFSLMRYHKVTVEHQGNNQIHRTDYEFDTSMDIDYYYVEQNPIFPFPPPPDFSWRTERLLKKIEYVQNSNGLFSKLKETENFYTNTNKISSYGIVFRQRCFQSNGQISRFFYKAYRTYTEFGYLSKTVEKIFASDNANSLESATQTKYSNTHYSPIETIQTSSSGKITKSYTKYSLDFIDTNELNYCKSEYTQKMTECKNNYINCYQSSVNTSGCRSQYPPSPGLGGDVYYHNCLVALCDPARLSCQELARNSNIICQIGYINSFNGKKFQAMQIKEYQTAAIFQMQLNNQITTPIEQWTTIIGEDGVERVTSAMLYEYGVHPQNTNLVVQKGIQVLEIDKPLAGFVPSKIENLVFKKHVTDAEGNGYTRRINFDTFDEKGNLLQQRKTDDIPQAYIWGYNRTVPIAQVINATLGQIYHTSFEEYLTGVTIIDDKAQAKTGRKYFNGTYTLQTIIAIANEKYVVTYFQFENNEWKYKKMPYTVNMSLTGMIDEVRIYPEGALMTTATYDPLIGKTSETDTNGITTYYEYDSANRLKFIKDQDKNIIQRFTYKYAE